MIKKRIGNKIILAVIAGMLGLTGMGISESVSSAANTSDKAWEFALSYKKTDVNYTNKRRKDNNSKIYVNWQSTVGGDLTAITVGAFGCYSDSSKKYPAGRLDGDKKRFCVMNGTGKYALTNYVNELGYSHAKIGLRGVTGSGVARGVWSPDCAGSYTVLK